MSSYWRRHRRKIYTWLFELAFWFMVLLAFSMFLTTIGCSGPGLPRRSDGPGAVVEIGYIGLDARAFGQHSVEALQTSYRVEAEVARLGDVALDLGAGPTTVIPLDGKDRAFLLDSRARLRWDLGPIQPYLAAGAGGGYIGDWRHVGRLPQGTKWGFVLQASAGVQFDTGFFADIRWWHESNGSRVFGHGIGPNPGFESVGIFVGYSTDF